MSRVRMEWGWVKEYPIFVYMRFITHNKWEVKVVKGQKGNQNAGNTSPSAPTWFHFESNKTSRFEVYKEAQRRAEDKLFDEGLFGVRRGNEKIL